MITCIGKSLALGDEGRKMVRDVMSTFEEWCKLRTKQARGRRKLPGKEGAYGNGEEAKNYSLFLEPYE